MTCQKFPRKFDPNPYSLVFNADTCTYSILANVQCAEEKGKAKAESDGSDCGDEASIDVDRISPHQASEDLYVFFYTLYLSLSLLLSRAPSAATTAGNATSDVEDGEIEVMSPECQDPVLAQTYLGLPVIR